MCSEHLAENTSHTEQKTMKPFEFLGTGASDINNANTHVYAECFAEIQLRIQLID